MFHIIKFDMNQYDPTAIQDYCIQIKKILKNDDMILALPYGIDFLYNCPKEELISIRNHINTYLDQLEENNKNDL